MDVKGFYIDGAWTPPAAAGTVRLQNPSTEESLGEVPHATNADIDLAVGAARRAFDAADGWPSWDPARRAEVMERLADAFEHHAETMAELVSLQNGMPIAVSRMREATIPPAVLRYYASLARETAFEEFRTGFLSPGGTVRRLPVGVVAAIVPWNYPQMLTMYKIAPALAAGCTAVVKPAPETMLDAFLLGELLDEAGVPAGVVNIVPGDGAVGAHLVSHPGVDKVAFTGSTCAGRAIARACGELLRPVTLELGGKSAAIVLDDVEFDLDAMGEAFYSATMINNGQTCHAGTRVLVPRSRYTEIVDGVTDLARSLPVGDAIDPATRVGPLVSARQRERVEHFIRIGREQGARLTTGGDRPAGLDRGWFVAPTVFADVDNAGTIAREEIFGPVLSLIPYGDVDEAVSIANDSAYGLGGTVWTSDVERGAAVARRIRTGVIGVNRFRPDPALPFGGFKDSGLGRELGPEGLGAYLESQSLYA